MSSTDNGVLTTQGDALIVALNWALLGQEKEAGEALWELDEDYVNQALAALGIVQQGLLAVGTNFQFGRLLAAKGEDSPGKDGTPYPTIPMSDQVPRVPSAEERAERAAHRRAAHEDMMAHEMAERQLDEDANGR